MDYQKAETLLAKARNPEAGKPIANNTRLYRRDGGNIAVRLHNTDIIIYRPDGAVSLNTGGWYTVTTKARINEYAPGCVYSDKGTWYYSPSGARWSASDAVPFQDGITIYPDGTVTGAGPEPDHAAMRRLKRAVKKYAADYVAALYAGKIPAPSNGDCWGCLMVAADGSHPMGGRDHILSHIEDKYYVPSLVVNAAERFGASVAMKHDIAACFAGETDKVFPGETLREVLARMVYRWCLEEVNRG